jgi:sporulation protein YlmC with PRC-barrel domain
MPPQPDVNKRHTVFRSGIRLLDGALAKASEAMGADVVGWRQQEVGTISDLAVEKGGTVSETPRADLAGTILESRIRTLGGDTLGELEDLVLDLTEGRVAYAAVSFGGILELAEKVTLVPVDRFELVVPFDGLVLNADEQTIRGAPCFRESDWPGLAEPKWFRGVRNCWQGN